MIWVKIAQNSVVYTFKKNRTIRLARGRLTPDEPLSGMLFAWSHQCEILLLETSTIRRNK